MHIFIFLTEIHHAEEHFWKNQSHEHADNFLKLKWSEDCKYIVLLQETMILSTVERS